MADHGHGGGHDSHAPSGGGHGGGKSAFLGQPIVRWAGIISVAFFVLIVLFGMIAHKGGTANSRLPGTSPTTTTFTSNIPAASDGCSGTSLSIDIGPDNELIDGGVKCDMVGWNIDSGEVIIVDSAGEEHTFASAEGFSFEGKRWRAASGHAHVTAAFCPPHTVWNGANACT